MTTKKMVPVNCEFVTKCQCVQCDYWPGTKNRENILSLNSWWPKVIAVKAILRLFF